MGRRIVTGQPVSQALRQAAKDLRASMTIHERMLWKELRNGRLGRFHFRRQQIIGAYIADFYCEEAGLVVEIDGPIHGSHREKDRERDRLMASWGLRVLRVTNEEVADDLDGVLKRVLAAAEEPNPRPLP